MSGKFFSVWFNILFLIALSPSASCQEIQQKGIRIMFYNVENLFDIYNDSLTNDDDFTPVGLMRWNNSRYYRKLNSLYKTIAAAGEWNMPEIIALCEVENRRVIKDLISETYLSKYDYGIIHEDSPDLRGIDVCMIYRKDVAEILDYRYLVPSGKEMSDFHSRSVLYASLRINTDTLHIIVNHWPSRRGGALAGEDLRKSIAVMVADVCNSVNKACQGNGKILICGDFNSTPDDTEIETLLNSVSSGLVNLSLQPSETGEGSYRYKGTWEMIDQVIVSKTLLNTESGLCISPEGFRIFKPGFLLEIDPVYPGSSPFATYRGYRYHGGYSDHLPVIVDLFMTNPDQQE
jgi:predicted extracellular nuclease